MSKDNFRRFGLHVAFGAAALAVDWFAANAGLFKLDASQSVVFVTITTALASFFRKEAS